MWLLTRFDEVEGNVFRESSRINSTWGGSLVDMVRLTIYLELIEKENLVIRLHKQVYSYNRAYNLQNEFPSLFPMLEEKGCIVLLIFLQVKIEIN